MAAATTVEREGWMLKVSHGNEFIKFSDVQSPLPKPLVDFLVRADILGKQLQERNMQQSFFDKILDVIQKTRSAL